jgi:RNA polymerase sigma-70 factor (ECF subfamily)
MSALDAAIAAPTAASDPDAALVASARSDPSRFAVLYDRYFDRVHGYVRVRIGDRAAGEDVTSEVFCRALAKLHAFRGRGPFAAWLFRIARNAVRDEQRRRPRSAVDPAAAADAMAALGPGPEDIALAHERALRLRAAIAEFGRSEQHLLALRYGAGLSGEEPAGSPSLTGEASAAAILRAAAAQAPAAGQVAHYGYDFTATFDSRSITGTSDVWTDPTASPARSAQTVWLVKGPKGGAPMLLGRFIDLGGAIIGYDATHDAKTLPSASNAAPAIVLPNEAFDGPQLVAALKAAGSRVSAVPEQSIDGVAVDPIRVVGILARPGLQVTFYFNHATRALQGFDAASADQSYPAPSWRVRLRSEAIEPAAHAPADAFSLAGLPVARVADRPNKDGTSPDGSEVRTALAAGVTTPSQAAAMQSQLAAELQAFSAHRPSGLG